MDNQEWKDIYIQARQLAEKLSVEEIEGALKTFDQTIKAIRTREAGFKHELAERLRRKDASR